MSATQPEVVVSAELARQLIKRQFPEIPAQDLSLLGEGHHVRVWEVDGRFAFRFPKREDVVPGLRRELAALPLLQDILPIPVPNPEFRGEPEGAYPWPFMGSPLLPGRQLSDDDLDTDSRHELAAMLGAFLGALHAKSNAVLAAHTTVDFGSRECPDVAELRPRIEERLAVLADRGIWVAPPPVMDCIARADLVPSSRDVVLVHGDLQLSNLLFHAGRPSAVIDWTMMCLGDRSVDLALYWSLLTPHVRESFLLAYGPTDELDLLRAQLRAISAEAGRALFYDRINAPTLVREAVAGLVRTTTSR